jgi:pyridoxal phosphate enzyme (YggS family)
MMADFDPNDIAAKAEIVKRNAQPVLEAAESAPQRVTVVAVTKYVEADWCCAAVDAGLTELGENRVLEGIEKYDAVRATGRKFTAHMVGPIQSNKAKKVPGAFDFVQSLGRHKIARRLQARCEELDCELPVLVEVNIDDEAQKAGVLTDEVLPFSRWLKENCARLSLRGVMCIPKWPEGGVVDEAYERSSRESFGRTRELYDELKNEHGSEISVLSMGMSADYQWAIEEGATMIRVGRMLWEE